MQAGFQMTETDSMATKPALAIALALVAAGCTYRGPVVGRLDDGRSAQGIVTVGIPSGAGTFSVSTLDGLTCAGTYDGWDDSPTVRIPVTCTDGRKGEVLATRSREASGAATARLDDGATGTFLFGDFTPAERAAFLTSAKNGG